MYRKDADIVAVKDGFSYPGFFFTWVWAFAKRLWGVGIFFFLLNIMAFSFFEWMPYKNFLAIHHLPSLWMTVNFSAWMAKALLGYFGNRLRGNKLIRQGYTRLPGTIRAKTFTQQPSLVCRYQQITKTIFAMVTIRPDGSVERFWFYGHFSCMCRHCPIWPSTPPSMMAPQKTITHLAWATCWKLATATFHYLARNSQKHWRSH